MYKVELRALYNACFNFSAQDSSISDTLFMDYFSVNTSFVEMEQRDIDEGNLHTSMVQDGLLLIAGQAPWGYVDGPWGRCAISRDLEIWDRAQQDRATRRADLLAQWLYNPETSLASIRDSNGISFSEFQAQFDLLVARAATSRVRYCQIDRGTAIISNVQEYVNLRLQPSLDSAVVRQVPLGERVFVQANDVSLIGLEHDRQSCSDACASFGRNPNDRTNRARAQQCISENMVWVQIADDEGNLGWVSLKFLETELD